MKMPSPVILFLAAPLLFVASAGERPRPDHDSSAPAIQKLLPADYANFESCIRGDHGLADAEASIQLLSKVKDKFRSAPSEEVQLRALRTAYQATWRICLQEFQQTKDEVARELILTKWNQSLQLDDDTVPSQVCALLGHWDRHLLTDTFWRLVMRTKNLRTVASFSYVFYVHGERRDVERLEGRLKREENSAIGELIVKAVNYMNWRLSGSKGPGPAAMPPRLPE
jgi:hypothetical protein